MKEQFDFNAAAQKIQETIDIDNAAAPYKTILEIKASNERREQISNMLDDISKGHSRLTVKYRRLPSLPAADQMQWAQDVLCLNNLVFLEIDTTGLNADQHDEITRFTLVDTNGDTLYDVILKPMHARLSPEASRISGLTDDDLANGRDAKEVWQEMQRAVRGYYVISYNQSWDRDFIRKFADRHKLPNISFVGECLQNRAMRWYDGEYGIKLHMAAARVGAPMPEPPEQTAIHRAKAQANFVHAMAGGITTVSPDLQNDRSDDLGALDDHPF